jgi:hypothetical protein
MKENPLVLLSCMYSVLGSSTVAPANPLEEAGLLSNPCPMQPTYLLRTVTSSMPISTSLSTSPSMP